MNSTTFEHTNISITRGGGELGVVYTLYVHCTVLILVISSIKTNLEHNINYNSSVFC